MDPFDIAAVGLLVFEGHPFNNTIVISVILIGLLILEVAPEVVKMELLSTILTTFNCVLLTFIDNG